MNIVHNDVHMKRSTFFLPDSQIAKLKEIAKRDDFSVAELIRRAISNFIEQDEALRGEIEKSQK